MKSFPILFFALAVSAPGGAFTIERDDKAVTIKDGTGHVVLGYQLERPARSKLSVESACYFHPFSSPNGTVLSDVAPSDHLHHRGIFLAWVEMHGKQDADFWGWGEHAPKENRRIVHRQLKDLSAGTATAGFRALNDWMAADERVLAEELHASVRQTGKGRVLDLTYRLTPDADLVLARWAFSGFCVRMPKAGRLVVSSPEGPVRLPNPSHLKPESDWPEAAWYDYTLELPEDKTAGIAVINHPENPPTLWHNHRDIRMLNPCIVAPEKVRLKANQPLVLRYRLVAYDGPAAVEVLDNLAREFGAKE